MENAQKKMPNKAPLSTSQARQLTARVREKSAKPKGQTRKTTPPPRSFISVPRNGVLLPELARWPIMPALIPAFLNPPVLNPAHCRNRHPRFLSDLAKNELRIPSHPVENVTSSSALFSAWAHTPIQAVTRLRTHSFVRMFRGFMQHLH